MPYQITGTLKLPDGTPASNVDIEFISQQNYSPLVRDLSNVIRTGNDGRYSINLEYGEYAMRLIYGNANPLYPGKVFVFADTPAGQDLPSLMQAANFTPATPEYIQQIQAWLAEAKAAEAAASASASAAKVSETNSKGSETRAKASEVAVEADRVEVAAAKTAVLAAQADVTTKASQASTSASSATSSRDAAAASASAASQKASDAAASEVSAKASADRAENAANVVVGALVDAGPYNASSGVLPTPVMSGTIKLSSIWKVTGNGIAGGIDLGVGDSLVYTARDNSYYKIDNTESVSKVNNKTGVVVLGASDVGAAPDGFGVGGNGSSLIGKSCNDAKGCGFFSISSSTTESPDPSGSGPSGSSLINSQFSASAASQIFFSYTSDRVFSRRMYMGEFKPWFEFYSTANKPRPADVGADPAGTASSAVSSHEAKSGAHPVSGISGLAALVDAISQPLGCSEWDRLRTKIRPGHVPSDGQLLKRADHPDMWAAISAGNVPVVADSDWLADPYKRASFTAGDGSTTFRVPDENGKFAGSLGALFHRGDGLNSAGVNGVIQGDAIREIGGDAYPLYVPGASTGTGAFRTEAYGLTPAKIGVQGADPGGSIIVKFKASNVVPVAADNHPLSATGCWVVKVMKSSKIAGLN